MEFDADKDYHIDQTEFLSYISSNGLNGKFNGLEEFAKMDTNGDGKISSVEFDSDLSEEMVEKEHRKWFDSRNKNMSKLKCQAFIDLFQ